tara:strand:+ start:1937 stop:2662 length:726 start_codon:yes stop_codon:yes gene_type:complete
MAGMIKSMFGKTVSELTAERQKRTDAIVQSIMSGAGNTQYDQNVARLGGNLGVWGGKKLANWWSGGDKKLEAAKKVEELQGAFNERLATGDYTDPEWLRGTANIKFRMGDEAGGNQYEGLANVQDKIAQKEAYYDSIPEKEFGNMVRWASLDGNYPLLQSLNSSAIRRAEKAAVVDVVEDSATPPADGSFDLSGEIGSNYINNAPTDAENASVKYNNNEILTEAEWLLIKDRVVNNKKNTF